MFGLVRVNPQNLQCSKTVIFLFLQNLQLKTYHAICGLHGTARFYLFILTWGLSIANLLWTQKSKHWPDYSVMWEWYIKVERAKQEGLCNNNCQPSLQWKWRYLVGQGKCTGRSKINCTLFSICNGFKMGKYEANYYVKKFNTQGVWFDGVVVILLLEALCVGS